MLNHHHLSKECHSLGIFGSNVYDSNAAQEISRAAVRMVNGHPSNNIRYTSLILPFPCLTNTIRNAYRNPALGSPHDVTAIKVEATLHMRTII